VRADLPTPPPPTTTNYATKKKSKNFFFFFFFWVSFCARGQRGKCWPETTYLVFSHGCLCVVFSVGTAQSNLSVCCVVDFFLPFRFFVARAEKTNQLDRRENKAHFQFPDTTIDQ
jgi:Flp pilus assembly protein TadB